MIPMGRIKVAGKRKTNQTICTAAAAQTALVRVRYILRLHNARFKFAIILGLFADRGDMYAILVVMLRQDSGIDVLSIIWLVVLHIGITKDS